MGFASGDIPALPLNLLPLKGAAAIGVFWGEAVRRDGAGFVADMTFALQAVADGRLTPHIQHVLPLSQAREAIGILDRREATGKIVLEP